MIGMLVSAIRQYAVAMTYYVNTYCVKHISQHYGLAYVRQFAAVEIRDPEIGPVLLNQLVSRHLPT
jgi:hypothetical protein